MLLSAEYFPFAQTQAAPKAVLKYSDLQMCHKARIPEAPPPASSGRLFQWHGAATEKALEENTTSALGGRRVLLGDLAGTCEAAARVHTGSGSFSSMWTMGHELHGRTIML